MDSIERCHGLCSDEKGYGRESRQVLRRVSSGIFTFPSLCNLFSLNSDGQIVSLYNASMRCAAASQKPLDAVQWYRLALALLQDTLPIVDDAIRAPLRVRTVSSVLFKAFVGLFSLSARKKQLQALIRMGLSQYKSELFSEAENLADLLLQVIIEALDSCDLSL